MDPLTYNESPVDPSPLQEVKDLEKEIQRLERRLKNLRLYACIQDQNSDHPNIGQGFNDDIDRLTKEHDQKLASLDEKQKDFRMFKESQRAVQVQEKREESPRRQQQRKGKRDDEAPKVNSTQPSSSQPEPGPLNLHGAASDPPQINSATRRRLLKPRSLVSSPPHSLVVSSHHSLVQPSLIPLRRLLSPNNMSRNEENSAGSPDMSQDMSSKKNQSPSSSLFSSSAPSLLKRKQDDVLLSPPARAPKRATNEVNTGFGELHPSNFPNQPLPVFVSSQARPNQGNPPSVYGQNHPLRAYGPFSSLPGGPPATYGPAPSPFGGPPSTYGLTSSYGGPPPTYGPPPPSLFGGSHPPSFGRPPPVGPTPATFTPINAPSRGIRSEASTNNVNKIVDAVRPDEELEPEETPDGLTVPLFPHQKLALAWLKMKEASAHRGGILADDMGLGKTIQMISLILSNRPTDTNCQTTLVIAPVGLLAQWKSEIETKVKEEKPHRLSVYIAHGKTKKPWAELKDFDVVITTYDTVKNEYKDLNDTGEEDEETSFFGPAQWYRVILDEAQNIKNRETKAAIAIFALDATYRFCLTGTPMMNGVQEIYPLLKFLNIQPWNDLDEFNKDFGLPLTLKKKKEEASDEEKQAALQQLRGVLRAIMLRRNKHSKIDGKPIVMLPPMTTQILAAVMDDDERAQYDARERKAQYEYKTTYGIIPEASSATRPKVNLLKTLTILRLGCLHPRLADHLQYTDKGDVVDDSAPAETTVKTRDEADEEDEDTMDIDDDNVEAVDWHDSSKIRTTVRLLASMGARNANRNVASGEKPEKALVFSSFVSFLDLVEAALVNSNMTVCRYQGGMNVAQRSAATKRLEEDDTCTIMLLSLSSGNAGLNLVAASNVILLDPFWNPYVEEQAIGRAHRIGQKRPVNVYRIIVHGTIEDRILSLQQRKQDLISSALDERSLRAVGRLEAGQVKRLLGL